MLNQIYNNNLSLKKEKYLTLLTKSLSVTILIYSQYLELHQIYERRF
jgi:hypothetical protein